MPVHLGEKGLFLRFFFFAFEGLIQGLLIGGEEGVFICFACSICKCSMMYRGLKFFFPSFSGDSTDGRKAGQYQASHSKVTTRGERIQKSVYL